jgi:hypothetical protein
MPLGRSLSAAAAPRSRWLGGRFQNYFARAIARRPGTPRQFTCFALFGKQPAQMNSMVEAAALLCKSAFRQNWETGYNRNIEQPQQPKLHLVGTYRNGNDA